MIRTLGYALGIVGAVVLAIYGGYYYVVDFLLDSTVSLIVRLGLTSIIVGGVLLVASLIRERIRDRSEESFRGVER